MDNVKGKSKVLIVDDTPENLGVLFNLLNEEYEVLAAEGGSVALEIVAQDKPDLILLDIMMPDINGFEVCTIIKENPNTAEIPVIFISALTDTKNKVEGFNIGGVDYITKPFQQEEVLSRVKTHLQIKNLTHQLSEANKKLENKVETRTNELRDELDENGRVSLALMESEKRFKMLFDSAPEMMLLIDISSSEIIDINSTGCELLGKKHEDVIGSNHEDYFKANDNCNDVQAHIKNSTNKKKRSFPNNLIKADGTTIPIETSVKTVLVEGNIVLMAMIHDISERVQYHEELIEAKEEAEEMNRLKSVFLANMSHELRTPMISIMGFSEILYEEHKNDEMGPMVANIRKSGKRLLDTFNLLLRLTELQSNSIVVNKELCDINLILLDILNDYGDQLKNLSIEFINEIPMMYNVYADESMLKELLYNMISNAMKFTQNGEIRISSKNSRIGTDEFNEIIISDTGVGIKKEYIELIFDPFRQASEGYNRNFEGAGLGLSITKKLVDLNNGHIKVESEEGKGSSFTISLPVEQTVLTESAQ